MTALRWVALILALTLAATLSPAHAQSVEDVIAPEVEAWADYLGLDVLELAGAVNTTGLHPEDYLVAVGAVERAEQTTGWPGCPGIIVERFGATAEAACAVSWCESRWDPGALGRLGEQSYFQVHPLWGDYRNPEANVEFAYELSAAGTNWRAWSCKP